MRVSLSILIFRVTAPKAPLGKHCHQLKTIDCRFYAKIVEIKPQLVGAGHRPLQPNMQVHTDSLRISEDSVHSAGRSRAPPLPRLCVLGECARIRSARIPSVAVHHSPDSAIPPGHAVAWPGGWGFLFIPQARREEQGFLPPVPRQGGGRGCCAARCGALQGPHARDGQASGRPRLPRPWWPWIPFPSARP